MDLCALGVRGGGWRRGGSARNSCTVCALKLYTFQTIECAKGTAHTWNMRLPWHICSPFNNNAHWYIHLFLHLSSSYWVHATSIGYMRFLLVTGCSFWLHVWGTASRKIGSVRTWCGWWWLKKGRICTHFMHCLCIEVVHNPEYWVRSRNRM